MGVGSEIRDPKKTYSGSRIQRSKRHRIRIRSTGVFKSNKQSTYEKTYFMLTSCLPLSKKLDPDP